MFDPLSHVIVHARQDVDARDKPGHDGALVAVLRRFCPVANSLPVMPGLVPGIDAFLSVEYGRARLPGAAHG
jgi:hypothetical protein